MKNKWAGTLTVNCKLEFLSDVEDRLQAQREKNVQKMASVFNKDKDGNDSKDEENGDSGAGSVKQDSLCLSVSVLFADNLIMANPANSQKGKQVKFSTFIRNLMIIASYVCIVGWIFSIIEGWSFGSGVYFVIVK